MRLLLFANPNYIFIEMHRPGNQLNEHNTLSKPYYLLLKQLH